jgi:intracellular sulfur oxidation DsrE/DsrF family protein
MRTVMLEDLHTATPRRNFIGQVAGAAIGLSAATLLPDQLHAATPTAAAPQLEAWFGRLKGKHRVVFDAPAANEGMPAVWPRVYLNTIMATYPGEPATAMVVLRHKGLALALQDAVWAKYQLGLTFGIVGPDLKPATKNPYATITTLPLPRIGVAELLKAGVLIGACDVALTVYSASAASKLKMDPAAVKKEWVAGLFPGIQVVPSGVMGVARAQELGANYIFAG